MIADPASLTSIHLFQILASGLLQKKLPLLPPSSASTQDALHGRLLIGNQAIDYRLRAEESSAPDYFWDLGEQWQSWTGLPFVYAVWVLRRELKNPGMLADALRKVAALGTAVVRGIAASQTEYPRSFSERYLTEHIQFGVGELERFGLARFSELLEVNGLVAAGRGALESV